MDFLMFAGTQLFCCEKKKTKQNAFLAGWKAIFTAHKPFLADINKLVTVRNGFLAGWTNIDETHNGLPAQQTTIATICNGLPELRKAVCCAHNPTAAHWEAIHKDNNLPVARYKAIIDGQNH